MSTIDRSAEVQESASVGGGTVVWGLAQIRSGACVGRDCVVGRGAYIDAGVVIGSRVKMQNYALVYQPAVVEDGAFIGPAAVLTNDRLPRAVNPDGLLKSAADWTSAGVLVREGASIGARAVCVAPVSIGRWAMVGAGAVVTSDVPDFALVVGTPARQVGWVGRNGQRLDCVSPGRWTCPTTGEEYMEMDGRLVEVVHS